MQYLPTDQPQKRKLKLRKRKLIFLVSFPKLTVSSSYRFNDSK